MTFSSIRRSWYSRTISLSVILAFITTMVITPKASYAGGVLGLPQPGTMVSLSSSYVPLMITGLTVHPENPLLMDFIVSTGNSGMSADQVKKESDRLIKYFLACLTIPENDQWVNLSPYEKKHIVPEDLGQTVLGQDMLAQDYLLKQLTASLIYPEKNLGKSFWDKVYAKANQMYGTSQIPVNTFNKVWILPDTAKVFEHKDTVFVVKSHLKVMLDEDYLALTKHDASSTAYSNASGVNPDKQQVNDLGNQIVRQIVLPAIEQEVNTGRNFAQMRQIYNSMILAVWFKKSLKQALLNQVYTDKAKVNGVNVDDPAIKEKIYRQYLEAYKKGVFNYIKEEVDPATQETIPRKYFSGGLTAVTHVDSATTDEAMAAFRNVPVENHDYIVSGSTQRADQENEGLNDKAMTAIERLSPQQIQDRFALAYPDALYLSVLIAKYLSDRIKPVLGKNAIASALLNDEARQTAFGMIDGKSIMDDQANSDEAKDVHIRVLELKGGLGTSFKREATLLRLTGRTTLADKGTDSYFENIPVEGFDASGNPKQFNENISVAELKLLQYVHLAQQKQFSEVEVQELVNPESQEAVSKFWDTKYLADRVDDRIPDSEKRTYRQVFADPKNGLHFNPDFIVQGVMPVVDAQTGEYNNNEALRSPGGHGAFVAVTMDENARNQKDLSVPRITVFTNGDGVNNMLPPAVAGWMVREKAPIVMVTTTKQLLDLKGGLITLLSNKDLPANIQEKLSHFETLSMEDIADLQSALYPYLLEIAQAKAEGQQDIFQDMGITLGEKSAQFFNTNVHAQYHNILDPFLSELRGILGDEKFYEIIGPDLITNPKEKSEDGTPQGKKIKVIQLEGASGSALLAMNRFILTTTDPRVIALKEKYGIKRLVYFVNFDEKLRSEVFTPEKFTWDHYLYAFTDIFAVDVKKGRLKFTPSPGRDTLPGFDLGGEKSPYADLEYDINAFGHNLSVKGLDYLAINGEVRIPNAILRGGVFIKNRSGKVVDLTAVSNGLPSENGRLVLDNVAVNIDQNGNLSTKPVANLLEAISNFDNVDAAMQTAIDDGTADEVKSDINPVSSNTVLGDRAMTVETKPIENARLAKFGTSGDRGIIDWDGDGKGDFNIGLVRRDVQGIAAHLLGSTDKRTIIIGYDTRQRNPEFSKEAARIMAANGFKVLYAAQEATPTPVLAILAADRNVAGVINFTASHSPYTDGGIKFSSSNGGAADTDTTDSIEKLANEAASYKVTDYEGAVRDGQITELNPQDVVEEYVNGYLIPTLKSTKAADGVSAWDDIVNYIKNDSDFNLVVDPMQGTGVRTMQLLYSEIAKAAGRQFFKVIHTDNNDPKFTQTGGAPQPAGKFIQGLLDEVKQTPHTMGIAVDGDVDRFGVVDFGGRQFEANEMLGMFAWFLKKDIGLDGSLVKTVATSNFANAVAEHLGMKLIETPVGFKYAVQHVMNGENVLVAGEESAHVGVGPFMKSWDDGFVVDLMALWLVAKTGKTLAEYKSGIEKEINQSFALKVNTVRDAQGAAKASVNALIAAAKKQMAGMPATEITLAKEAERLTGQKVVDINTMDGVKLVFASGDSILMRPSGTEPAAKLYVEVSNPERLDGMFKNAEALMGTSADKAQISDGAVEDDDIIRPVATTRTTMANPGGIDLNTRTLNMESSGQKVDISFDPVMISQFKRGDFSGVKIQILDVVPVNLMPLLGLAQKS